MSQTSEQVVDAILDKIAARDEKPGDISSFLAVGGGTGAALGTWSSLARDIPNIKKVIQLSGQLPEQEAQNLGIKRHLKEIKKIHPTIKRMQDRAVLNDLLDLPRKFTDIRKENPILKDIGSQLPPKEHYKLRQGYEEGLVGHSRSARMMKALKNLIRKNVLKKGLVGLGVGLGGGLLGATSVGHFDKKSEVITDLLPHQQRVIDRLKKNPGLLVAHGLGTGKTLSSIAVADSQDGKTTALVPASLRANYEKEISKHTDASPNIDVRSMQGAALRSEQIPSDLLVVDEAHRARETSTKLYQLLKDYPAASRMLLTATPVYNRPSDIAPLVNIVAGEKVLPTGREFNKKYIAKPPSSLIGRMFSDIDKPTLTNTEGLKKVLNKWVDYQKVVGEDFPERKDEAISVQMNPEQTALHDFAWGKLPFMSRMRIRAGLPASKQDLSKINMFQSQARQVSGSTKRFGREEGGGVSPKLERAFSDLQNRLAKDPEHRAVVYSNYLDTLGDYAKNLESKSIPHAVFSGQLSQKDRQKAVQDYNEGRLKALLVSSAGGEGLDLKGTRQLQVLEPHWNEEKLDQVIGRAIRHKSHAHLPKDKRDVLVQRYMTYPKPGFLGRIFNKEPRGVEQVLAEAAKNKKDLNEQLLRLL